MASRYRRRAGAASGESTVAGDIGSSETPPAPGSKLRAAHLRLEPTPALCFLERMARKNPLSDAALEQIARRFAVLAEPMRLRLIQALFDGERHVGALVTATGGSQANITRHLQRLTRANILARRREGLLVFHRIADPSIFPLCELVCGSLAEERPRHAGTPARRR